MDNVLTPLPIETELCWNCAHIVDKIQDQLDKYEQREFEKRNPCRFSNLLTTNMVTENNSHPIYKARVCLGCLWIGNVPESFHMDVDLINGQIKRLEIRLTALKELKEERK